MKKMFFVVVFLAVVFFAAAPASAQPMFGGYGGYYGGYNNAVAVQAANMGLVNQLAGGGFGPYGQSMYGMYGGDPCLMSIMPLLPNDMRPMVYGSAGAMGGYAVGGREHGQLLAGIFGIAGTVIGAVQDYRQRNRAEQAYMSCQQNMARQAMPQMQPLSQQVASQLQGPLAGPAAAGHTGEFRLRNTTRFLVDVYDGDEYLGRMRPREEWRISAPDSVYKAYALIPNQRGSLSNDETDLKPSDDGWVFVEPVFDPDPE